METVYDKKVDDTDYVQMRIANLLAAIANYRSEYDNDSDEYVIINSFFDSLNLEGVKVHLFCTAGSIST